MTKKQMQPTFADQLLEIVTTERERLWELREPLVSRRMGIDKWSIKEILGHLIDSAANNHQRFIRAQESEELVFPGYEQDFWVEANGYDEEVWAPLVGLWAHYNRHLTRLISGIPDKKLQHTCRIGTNAPVTLEFLIDDYIRHMRHHLRQIETLVGNTKSPTPIHRANGASIL